MTMESPRYGRAGSQRCVQHGCPEQFEKRRCAVSRYFVNIEISSGEHVASIPLPYSDPSTVYVRFASNSSRCDLRR